MSIEQTFNTTILPDVSPFSVQWDSVTTATHTSKAGGVYNTYLVPILGRGLKSPITVDMFKTDFDRLRILYLTGISTYSATFGLAKKEGGRAPLILSGASTERTS